VIVTGQQIKLEHQISKDSLVKRLGKILTKKKEQIYEKAMASVYRAVLSFFVWFRILGYDNLQWRKKLDAFHHKCAHYNIITGQHIQENPNGSGTNIPTKYSKVLENSWTVYNQGEYVQNTKRIHEIHCHKTNL
jgi:hypothetical protein